MAHRLRVVIQSHAGLEGLAFITALTRDAFTIFAGSRPADLLVTLIPAGFSESHKGSSKFQPLSSGKFSIAKPKEGLRRIRSKTGRQLTSITVANPTGAVVASGAA